MMRRYDRNCNSNSNSKITRSHAVVVVGLMLQLCAFVCLQNHQEIVVVESWSPKICPVSTTSWQPAIAFHDRVERRNSNQRSPSPFSSSVSRASVVLADSNAEDGSGDENDDDEPQFIEVESLSASQVMELIELSFFQACFALSKGSIEPLKLFIVAVKTASKKYNGASAMAIAMTVDSLPPSVRPLEPQEQELRQTWIQAIYLMMGHVLEDFDGGSSNDDEVTATYGPILVDLVAIHRTGMGLNVNQFVDTRKDILLPKGNVLVLEDGPEDEDLMRLAVVTQTINVLFTTLVVLGEEDDSSDAAAGAEEPASKSSSASPSKKKKKAGSSGKGFG